MYTSAGHIWALARYRHGDLTLLLASGVDNERAAAALAVLDESGSATSPNSSGSPYACAGCPTRTPQRYLLFPRSEVSRLLGDAYNYGRDAAVLPDHLEVSTIEVLGLGLRAIYRLTPDFAVESVGMSDAYWEAHRRLEREGRLNHRVEECVEYREGLRVRVWDGARWHDVVARAETAASATDTHAGQ